MEHYYFMVTGHVFINVLRFTSTLLLRHKSSESSLKNQPENLTCLMDEPKKKIILYLSKGPVTTWKSCCIEKQVHLIFDIVKVAFSR